MDEQQLDAALADALDAFDRATLAWNMSRMEPAPADRVAQLRVACATYEETLRALTALSADIQRTQAWQHWADEAQRSLSAARQDLQTLGA